MKSTQVAIALLCGLVHIAASAVESFAPSNNTQALGAAMFGDIVLATEQNGSLTAVALLLPVISQAAMVPSSGISYPLLHIGANNELDTNQNSIAFMSCDPADYPGNIQLSDVLAAQMEAHTQAIVMYSTTGLYCNHSGTTSDYTYLYSTISTNNSQTILSDLQAAGSMGIMSTVAHRSDLSKINSTSSTNGTGSGSGSGSGVGSLRTGQSTTVAMIALYSITGIITALFLAIIILGAVRARRHPERYGPRNILGRPRQSRAKGIARAMLETIPIVKFGDEEAGKTAQVELAETSQVDARNIEQADVVKLDTTMIEGGAGRRDSTSDKSIISPAMDNATSEQAAIMAKNEDAPGCSICTEDFETGQDVRLLPCNHKFHPACVDPWLLDISGTCPLCRIDLRPAEEENDIEEGQAGDMPPPLGRHDRRSFFRSVGLALVGTGGLGAQTTLDDRREMMRRWQAYQEDLRRLESARPAEAGQNAAGATSSTNVPSPEERTRRQRLTERFNIRTRRRASNGVLVETMAAQGASRPQSTVVHPVSTTAPQDVPPPIQAEHQNQADSQHASLPATEPTNGTAPAAEPEGSVEHFEDAAETQAGRS